MGLLDDAIREHLDLQRRRGADPAEVERAEREALGPVRRNRDSVDASQPDPEHEETAVAGGFAYDHEDDHDDWADEATPEPAAGAAGRSAPPDQFEDELGEPEYEPDEAPTPSRPPLPDPFDSAPHTAPPPRDWAPEERRPAAADRFHADAPGRRSPVDSSDETAEYHVEDALDEAADGEDVLEETPEFLQDTPDHDRLWFEQRPPRDFDFDG